MALLGCGGPVDPDAGPPDAAEVDAASLCAPSSVEPEIGVDPFCPAVHDYVDAVASGEIEGPGPWSYCGDGEIVEDAGPDSGCAPAAWGWSIVEGCDTWVSCELGGEPCYHCADWGSNPGAF